MKIWERRAAPTLRAAGAACETRVTTRAKEATEIVREADLMRYDGVVVVGGDGTVAEVFQGLRERGDEASTSTPLGVVPAGSGNALCKSIQHAGGEPCDPVSCALTIARGHTRALDRAEIRFRDAETGTWNETSTPTHSLLSTSWGFFSDVDVESEKFRCLGGARFTLQAIVRILSRRTYRCDFLYETTARGREHNERHYADADLGVRLSDRPGWRRVSGDVLGLWALNVPWGTETTLAAPRAEFNDGSLDVVLVRVTNRKNMLKLMLDFDAGAHVSNRAVAYLKVKSFELIPASPDDRSTTTTTTTTTDTASSSSPSPSSSRRRRRRRRRRRAARPRRRFHRRRRRTRGVPRGPSLEVRPPSLRRRPRPVSRLRPSSDRLNTIHTTRPRPRRDPRARPTLWDVGRQITARGRTRGWTRRDSNDRRAKTRSTRRVGASRPCPRTRRPRTRTRTRPRRRRWMRMETR